jgi:acyl-CoA thioesterase
MSYTSDAQNTAEFVGEAMFSNDRASQGLGMRVVAMGPGKATLTMTVRADMLNGFEICHGGFVTTLADSAFAFACNSYNEMTVASGLSVDLLAPSREGDQLTAEAVEVSQQGRTGVYDITVTNQRGERVAVVRGRSYRLKGRPAVPGSAAPGR